MITLTILTSVNDQNNSSCTCALGTRKVIGVGRRGIFEPQEFFSLSNFLYEFFLGHSMNIF